MLLKNFIQMISEKGRYQVFGYYTKLGLVFIRDDGCQFIYRG